MAPPDQASEGALIRSVLAGDSEAFYALVSPFQARVLFAILQNQADAEEVVQEAFLKAYKHLKDFRGEAKFSTWLFQILVNEARLRLRRSRLAPEESLDEALETQEGLQPRDLGQWGDDPEQKYAAEELRGLVRKAIRRIPVRYRVVPVLRDMEGLNNEEVAAAVGLSVPAVKSRLLRARLMLRESLAPHFRRRWLDRLPLGERMITCADMLRELSNYLDGEVDPVLRKELESHARSCKRCWVLIDSTRKTLRILADEQVFELPAGFSQRLWAGPARRMAAP